MNSLAHDIDLDSTWGLALRSRIDREATDGRSTDLFICLSSVYKLRD